MKKIKLVTTVIQYESIDELNVEEKTLVQEAMNVSDKAYAPYSKFSVGAAVLLENGKIITGTNQENAAYPSGLCAERVALFYANSEYPDVSVKAIAVAASTNNSFTSQPVPPCGSCRQVILETETRFKKPIKIIMAGKEKVSVINDAKTLLPVNFDEQFLEK